MKYKNKFLFICLIICLFSIASVCASDIGQTSDNQNDDLEIENQDVAVDDGDMLAAAQENSDDDLAQVEDEPVLERNSSQITVDADSIYVGETAKINVTVQNATGYVVVSVDNQTFNETLSNCEIRLNVSGLAYGSHNVAVFYGGDDNYLPDFKLETLYVKKLQSEITEIDIDEVAYGEDAFIEVSVPDGVEGDIVIRLNDALQTNITERIYEGKARFKVSGLAVGNYVVDAVYTGNYYYDASDVKSASFEVKKADPNLCFVSFEGTVYDNATIMVSINEEIHDEFVNITVGDLKYINHLIDDYGAIYLITDVLDEIKSYRVVVEYGGNENFKSSRIETYNTPKKINTYGITINATDIAINDDEIITVGVPDHVDDVVIWVNGQSYRNSSFTDNKATFKVTGLSEGIYTVTATVNDTEFDHKNFTSIFTVSMVSPAIVVFVLNENPIHVGDKVTVIVNVPTDATEDVFITFNGVQFSQKPVDGNATFHIDALTAGDKTLTAIYYGDDKYRNNVENAYFTVDKVKSYINVSTQVVSINDTEEIIFTLPDDASGNITVFVNEKTYLVAVSGGKGILAVSKLHKGEYPIDATYNGDGKYLASHNDTEIFRVIINSNQMDIIDEGNGTLSVYLSDDAKGNVTVEIDAKTFNGTAKDGVCKVLLTNATLGTHHAHVTYVDSESFETLESVVDVHIPKYVAPLSVDSSIIRVCDIAYVNVTAPKSATGNITIEVEGKSYTSAIENGIAKFEIILFSAGDTTLVVKYAGDDSFRENSTSAKLTAFKKDSSVVVNVTDIRVGEVAQIKITGPDDISGTAIVNINGINYTTFLTNGSGTVDVADLQSGNYDIVANYLENAYYLASEATQNVTVSKIQTTLLSSDVVSEYNGGKYLVATLRDIDGAAISGVGLSIDLNGVKYLTTDANGQVKLSLANVVPNGYNVAINFAGNGKYVKSTAAVKVTISKATPKLSAAKKTFKRKVKTKKYTVTLKTNKNAALKGVSVTLKIKNKKFTAKTNAAGKATFKIKKLTKKGKYTSTVSFKGNSCYNAVSKKVKITVK
jgi:hypothetical protein